MRQVDIVEVGPRDGLQNESTTVDTRVKVELIRRAVAAGVRRVEAVSFVHPQRVPQMADAEAVMASLPRTDDVSYIGLVLNRRGFERAVIAGVEEVNVVVVATDEFNRRNQGVTTAESLVAWGDVAAAARREGLRPTVTIAAAFGCPFTGEVPLERVVEVVRQATDAGPEEITLADTIGAAVPTEVTERLAAVAQVAPAVPLRIHLHNTRNAGYANAVAAVEAGAGALDASIGGIGGCPFAPRATGNIATEDLTWMLGRMGVATGVDPRALAEAGTWIAEQLARPAPALLGRAGVFPPG